MNLKNVASSYQMKKEEKRLCGKQKNIINIFEGCENNTLNIESKKAIHRTDVE